MPALNRRALLGAMGASLSLTPFRALADNWASRHADWAGSKRGAVSLSYDDGLDSQLDTAIPQLDAAGMRGTFFVTVSQIARRRRAWRAAAAQGHEVADHTMTHPCDLQRFTPEGFMAREIAPAEQSLERLLGPRRPHLFAYPCDVTDLGPGSANAQARRYAELLARDGIVAARTSEGDPNDPARVERRRYRLSALAAGYDAPNLSQIADYLDEAVDKRRWAILVFHNIRMPTGNPGDTSPAEHRAILEAIAARNLLCAPIGEILGRIGRAR